MKSKTTLPTKNIALEKALGTRKKTKSLRPMRSMLSVKSMKPKTVVAALRAEAEAH
ncbi:MAG: hypothetical protein ACJ76H_07890 [Bacteriovoracaceae bacterium]